MIDSYRHDPWDEALSGFWDQEVPESTYGPATVDKYRQAVTWLRRAAELPQNLDRASIVRMQKEAQQSGIAPETVNSVMGPARVVCDWFVGLGLIQQNPIDRKLMRLRPKNPRVREDKCLSSSDLVKILHRADYEFEHAKDSMDRWKAARMRALLYLWLMTGARKMELLRLRKDRYDGKTILIVGKDHPTMKVKTFSSERRVPVPDPAKLRLDEWVRMIDWVGPRRWLFPGVLKDVPWTSGCYGTRPLERVQQLANRAGLSTWVTIHNLRHTFATHAVMRDGLTAEQVGMIMGHSTVHTQRVYIHYDKQMMVDLMGRVTLGVDLSGVAGVVPAAQPSAGTPTEVQQGGCSDVGSDQVDRGDDPHPSRGGADPRQGGGSPRD